MKTWTVFHTQKAVTIPGITEVLQYEYRIPLSVSHAIYLFRKVNTVFKSNLSNLQGTELFNKYTLVSGGLCIDKPVYYSACKVSAKKGSV